MIKTETINHFTCDRCGAEFTPIDGDKYCITYETHDIAEFSDLIPYENDGPTMLCPECWKRALRMTLEKIAVVEDFRKRQGQHNKLIERLREINPDVCNYCTVDCDTSGEMHDKIVILHKDKSLAIIPIVFFELSDSDINRIVDDYREQRSKNNGGEDK